MRLEARNPYARHTFEDIREGKCKWFLCHPLPPAVWQMPVHPMVVVYFEKIHIHTVTAASSKSCSNKEFPHTKSCSNRYFHTIYPECPCRIIRLIGSFHKTPDFLSPEKNILCIRIRTEYKNSFWNKECTHKKRELLALFHVVYSSLPC